MLLTDRNQILIKYLHNEGCPLSDTLLSAAIKPDENSVRGYIFIFRQDIAMACFQNVGLPSHLCCIKQTWHWWDRSRLVPHQLPLHHWLDKILRLELSIGAEAGHIAQVLLPRGLLVKVAGVDPLASSTMLPLNHKCATAILFLVREKDHMQMHIASHHNLSLQLFH